MRSRYNRKKDFWGKNTQLNIGRKNFGKNSSEMILLSGNKGKQAGRGRGEKVKIGIELT